MKHFISKSAVVIVTVVATLAADSTALAKPKTISLPAGSVNALGAAIASVGSGGKVIVKSGVHTESGTVNIAIPVSIVGESGAIIENNIAPSVNYPLPIIPLLDIKNTRGVTVRGIWFRPSAGGTANCTVVIENAPGVQFVSNKITDFQFGVILQHADFARIDNNDMDLTDRWMLDPNDPNFLPESDGVIVANGRFVQITNNHVVCATVGIFASDKFGLILGNTVSMSYVGIQMCHLPPDPVFYTINGGTVSSDTPATNWSAIGNNVTSSAWGYQVIDGANHNALLNNAASNNSPYDVEFVGDSYRYGFFTPTSSNNLFVAGSQTGLVVKDCGSNDKIIGNVQLVDHNADPCY